MLDAGSLVGNLDDGYVPSLELLFDVPVGRPSIVQLRHPGPELGDRPAQRDPGGRALPIRFVLTAVRRSGRVQREVRDPLLPGEGLYHAVKGPVYGAARSRSIPRAISKKLVISRRTLGACAITV